MGTTVGDIREWLLAAPKDATHMLVVCDTYDYDDYPSYTDNPSERVEYYKKASMQRVMEVYRLSDDHEDQLALNRVWNV